MNVTVSHIRSALQECYPPREAANLSRIVCCEMLGQSHIDYYPVSYTHLTLPTNREEVISGGDALFKKRA